MTSLRLLVIVMLLATLVAAGGCSKLGLGREPRPRARVTGIEFGNWQLRSMMLNARVEITNPYPAPMPLTNIEYTLMLLDDRHEVATGHVATPYVVAPFARHTVTVPIEINFAETIRTARNIRLGMVVPYRVHVNLLVTPPATGSLRIPVHYRGEFPLPAPPLVFVDSIRIRTLTLTETHCEATLSITNNNEFPVALRAFSWRIALQGHELAAGIADGPLELDPKATGHLPVEFLASARQAGTALREVMRRGEADYALFAEFDLQSPHGNISQHVDRTGTVNLVPWRD